MQLNYFSLFKWLMTNEKTPIWGLEVALSAFSLSTFMVPLLVYRGKTHFSSLVITLRAMIIYLFMFHIHLCENSCEGNVSKVRSSCWCSALTFLYLQRYDYISHMHLISVVLKYVPSDFFFIKLLSSNTASYNTNNCWCEHFDSLASTGLLACGWSSIYGSHLGQPVVQAQAQPARYLQTLLFPAKY